MKARAFVSIAAVAVLAVALLPVAAWANAPGPSGNGIIPVFVDGNPTCVGLGYDHGFKVDPPDPGTYDIDGVNSVTVTTDGVYFDWTSTLGMDAVIAKGGPNANLYIYDPPAESFGDTHLHSPVNPSNGQPFGLSHIEFCYDYELTASKTANTSHTRTYTWTIDKSVDDNSHVGFTGDSFTSNYDVVVDLTVVDSDFAVSGEITINNPTPFSVDFSVSDSVGGTNATVNCPTNTLAAGASTVCTYSASLGGAVDGINTATITSLTAGVDGATASAPYAFGDPTTTVGYPTINVTDSVEGPLGSASDDHTFSYSRTFTCDDDEGNHPNTATIDETGQSDSESVTVECYTLVVNKDADPSFDRDWDWTIEKSGDQDILVLSPGQQFLVNYTVQVNGVATDSNWNVDGNISVHNPAPIDATINGVSDAISDFGAAAVDCGAAVFPYTLVAGGTLNCTYSAALPDGSDRTNTATATLQNSPSGTTDFSHTINISFINPTTETDECVDVSDDLYGFLGTVCDGDETFNYSLNVGPYAECGEFDFTNTASFLTNDTSTSGSDSHNVAVTVPCEGGCTLTPGYWKTHSFYGPAPYDDTWAEIGEDTTFFLSGQTYYQVLWTSPQGGNAYYILAHAYIAAELNFLNGASSLPAVQSAFDEATALFSTYTPAQIADAKGKSGNELRAQFIALATILDDYNNGLTGPGHCSE